jgi:hypothetical protein
MVLSAIKQIIKGHTYDSSSIELRINGENLFDSFQEVNYDWSAEIGKLRGIGSPIIKGRTRGQYEFVGNFVLAKSDANELIKKLAALGFGGFAQAEFDVVVTYSERGQGKPNVDTLLGCRLVGGSNAHSVGGDPLVVSFDLDMYDQLYDGFSPVEYAKGGGLAGVIGGLLP